MTENEHAALTQLIHDLAWQAGEMILRLYRKNIVVHLKSDASPVTEADEAADALIVAGLSRGTPDIPVVSEERVSQGHLPDIGSGRFWLVDPLDGTKEFISGTDEFTINIALIENGSPVLGALHAPALNACYLADGKRAFLVTKDGYREPIRVRSVPSEGAVVVASRNHRDAETDAFIARHHIARITSAGSALKFGILAKGEADLYPRFGRTMEWDTAAGHAVLTAAGGSVTRVDGTTLEYGKLGLDNPPFVARGLS